MYHHSSFHPQNWLSLLRTWWVYLLKSDKYRHAPLSSSYWAWRLAGRFYLCCSTQSTLKPGGRYPGLITEGRPAHSHTVTQYWRSDWGETSSNRSRCKNSNRYLARCFIIRIHQFSSKQSQNWAWLRLASLSPQSLQVLWSYVDYPLCMWSDYILNTTRW